MRAMILEELGGRLKPAEVRVPEPGPDEVLVRVRAAALNRRDLWICQGAYPGLKLPVIPGSDAVGTVEKAPSAAEWVGREVLIHPGLEWGGSESAQAEGFRILGMPDDGTFAEYVKVPLANVRTKPAHLEAAEAAALPLAGLTAYRAALVRGGVREGEKVLVTGIGGGVALAALQFCLARGAEVYVTSGHPEKLAKARELGAAGGADYSRHGWEGALRRRAGSFDCIIDSAGGRGFLSLIDLTRPGGRVVFFGATRGNPPEFPLRKAYWRQISILGTTMGSPRDFDAMLALIGDRRLRPVVDRIYPLSEVNRALARMESQEQMGKLVLDMRGQ